jgi:hypothetical protein
MGSNEPKSNNRKNKFIPKACWDFKPKTHFVLKQALKNTGSVLAYDVNLEQKFSIEKMGEKNGFIRVQIISEPLICSNEKYLSDFNNRFTFSKMGLNMTLQLDLNGEFQAAENEDEILAQLSERIKPYNTVFWKQFYVSAIQTNPNLFFKGIYDLNYGPVLKFINKQYDLPYKWTKEANIETPSLIVETKMLIRERIDINNNQIHLYTTIENSSNSFDLESEYNIKYKSNPHQSSYEAERIFTIEGQLQELKSKQNMSIGTAELYHTEKTIKAGMATRSINKMHFISS